MKNQDWKKYKIDDIADFYNSKRVPLNSRERENRKGPYPYYGASGIVDYLDDYLFDGDFVLISEDGENLRTRNTPIAFKASGKFWVNNHAHILKGKQAFLNDWIVYFFQNTDLNSYITGAVQPKLNKENLSLIDIAIPDFDTAKNIISILSALDDKIELNRQINATLEEIAQAIFKEWFVKFNYPGATGEMQESALGLIPKGWRVGSIEEILKLSNETIAPGSDPKKYFFHYSIPAYDSGRLPVAEQASSILSNKFKVRSNSILVSKLNPRIPRIWAVGEIKEDRSICSTEFLVMIPKKSFFYSFGLNLFSQSTIIEEMKGAASGTSGSHQRVRPQDVMDIQILIPDDAILILYDNIVGSYSRYILDNLSEAKTLSAIRNILLPKLMSGDITL